MTAADDRARRLYDEGPDEYFGIPLLTRDAEERAADDEYRRINDDRYRFEPWEVTLP